MSVFLLLLQLNLQGLLTFRDRNYYLVWKITWECYYNVRSMLQKMQVWVWFHNVFCLVFCCNTCIFRISLYCGMGNIIYFKTSKLFENVFIMWQECYRKCKISFSFTNKFCHVFMVFMVSFSITRTLGMIFSIYFETDN